VAILAGSRARGVASSAFDYDVTCFKSLPNDTLRKLTLKVYTSKCLRMTCAQAEGTGGADNPFETAPGDQIKVDSMSDNSILRSYLWFGNAKARHPGVQLSGV
jgi:hypothetical protein